MAKKYSVKFWIIFWTLSAIFLTGWYLFWQFKHQGVQSIETAIDYVPFLSNKEEYKAVAYFANYLLKNDNQEKTFLILFQNDMEIRPGGGYIGSFGIVKTLNGKITKLETQDLSNFDAKVPDGIAPPYPMTKMLHINSWKLRDSNYSPDFIVNAQKAEEFYHLGQGQENLDGIIAINTDVLSSFLQVTGPIEVEGYPGKYDSENAVINLEYQVEQGAYKQDIQRPERKAIMGEIAKIILDKVVTMDNSDKFKLAKEILANLNNKDIQLYFKDSDLESRAINADWGGKVDQDWRGDYLMMVDANLGALKSDYFMRRSFDYTVDFTHDKPQASLKITYQHTGKVRDWMTKDYVTYFRAYVPDGSWLYDKKNLDEITYGSELNKKYFGSIFGVKLGETKTVEMDYYLPNTISEDNYRLLIQKQSGLGEIPGKVTIIGKNGQQTFDVNLQNEWKSE